jgi:hypothetical protein
MKNLLFAILFTTLILSACQPANQSTSEGDQDSGETLDEILDTQGLADALESAGATVGQEGEVDQPFFSVPGQVITINGESIQVFEYVDSAQADAELIPHRLMPRRHLSPPTAVP